MKIVAWNCRGMGNGLAVSGLLDIQKKEVPDILFLSETKLTEKSLGKFRIKLGLMHMVARDCDGKSGGIALF